MTKIRTMIIGEQGFAVPPLPFGINRVVYPLCRKLELAGLVARVVEKGVVEAIDQPEMDDLAEIAFACAQACQSDLARADFDALATGPVQLFDAFFYVARYQTGVWLEVEAPAEPGAGEGEGAGSPPRSTSTASSPA